MAKRKIRTNKLVDWILTLVSVIASIGVGSLFISGTFMGAVILKFLPLIVHQVVGWTIIGGALLGLIMKIVK